MDITIEKRFVEADWVVRLNYMKVAFSTQAQAQAYADQLRTQLNTAHAAAASGMKHELDEPSTND